MIRGATDVMDSRHNSLLTFVSTAKEKLENLNMFQSKSPKTYTWVQILIAEGWLRYEWCNPKQYQLFAPRDDCITVCYFHACDSAAFWIHAFQPGHVSCTQHSSLLAIVSSLQNVSLVLNITWLLRGYVTTYYSSHAANHVIRFPRPSPSAFAYNEARITWITENRSQKETIMVIACWMHFQSWEIVCQCVFMNGMSLATRAC